MADVASSSAAAESKRFLEEDGSGSDADARPAKKTRGPKKICAYREEGGELEHISPVETVWYKLYVLGPMHDDDDWCKKFRQRFRLPYRCFLHLVDEADEKKWFSRWAKASDSKISSPLELMILGALRYLGRGWTFDDLEESTAISAEVHRVFFHEFVKVGSTVLYKKYVQTPLTAEEARNHTREYEAAGLHGCVGSTDATHITTEKCEFRLKQNHLSHKEHLPARTYNITVNNRRRILHSTHGGPSRWNDKTVVMFDAFVRGIHDGTVISDAEFQLYERRGRAVVPVSYKGSYVIADNGYLRWAATIPPYKTTGKMSEIRWSRWVESMRKDVECAFGILKGRWRILKTGMRVHGVDVVDRIWLTCCALHNWLLEEDGLDQPWDGPLGEVDAADIATLPGEIPQAIAARLGVDALTPRNFDLSGMGPADDDIGNYTAAASFGEAPVGGSVRIVRNLDRDYFRSKLVEHFDILFSNNSIQWPKANKQAAPLMVVN